MGRHYEYPKAEGVVVCENVTVIDCDRRWDMEDR